MRPSGETLDLVSPGMSRVVARLNGTSDYQISRINCEDKAQRKGNVAHILGEFGAVAAGVSVKFPAIPLVTEE